ncbi:MAG: hypothetical protein AAFZ07_26730 [Actinomycetota bacterium]
MLDRLFRLATRRLDVGADGDGGAEVLAVVEESVRRGSRWDAIAELAGLVTLWLRLRCRRATDDAPVVIWRQGLWLGGFVLLAVTTAELAVAAAAPTVDDRTLPTIATVFGVAALVALAAQRRAALLALAPPALVLAAAVASEGHGATDDLVRLGLGVVALSVGCAAPRHRPVRRALRWGAPALAAAVAASFVDPRTVTDVTTALVVVVVGGAFVGSGWFDPRLAVAATVVWTWRFLAVDPPRLGEAFAALAGDLDLEALLVRWFVMASGVAFGLAVSRSAVRRTVSL